MSTAAASASRTVRRCSLDTSRLPVPNRRLHSRKLSLPIASPGPDDDINSGTPTFGRSVSEQCTSGLEEVRLKPIDKSTYISKIEMILKRVLFKEARLELMRSKAATPPNTLRERLQLAMRAVLLATRKILIRKKVKEVMLEQFGVVQTRRMTHDALDLDTLRQREVARKKAQVKVHLGKNPTKDTDVLGSLMNARNVLIELCEDTAAAASVHLEMDAALDRYGTLLDNLYDNSFSALDDSHQLSKQIQSTVVKANKVLRNFAAAQPAARRKSTGEGSATDDEGKAPDVPDHPRDPTRCLTTPSLAMWPGRGGSASERDGSSASDGHEDFDVLVKRLYEDHRELRRRNANGVVDTTGILGSMRAHDIYGGSETGLEGPFAPGEKGTRLRPASSANSSYVGDGTSVSMVGEGDDVVGEGDDVDSNGSSDFESPKHHLSDGAARHQADRNRKRRRDMARKARKAVTGVPSVFISRTSDDETDHSTQVARGMAGQLERAATINHLPKEFNHDETAPAGRRSDMPVLSKAELEELRELRRLRRCKRCPGCQAKRGCTAPIPWRSKSVNRDGKFASCIMKLFDVSAALGQGPWGEGRRAVGSSSSLVPGTRSPTPSHDRRRSSGRTSIREWAATMHRQGLSPPARATTVDFQLSAEGEPVTIVGERLVEPVSPLRAVLPSPPWTTMDIPYVSEASLLTEQTEDLPYASDLSSGRTLPERKRISEQERLPAQGHAENGSDSDSDLALDVPTGDHNPDISHGEERLPCDLSASRDGPAGPLGMATFPSNDILEALLDAAELQRAASRAESRGPDPDPPESSSSKKVPVETDAQFGSEAPVDPTNRIGSKGSRRGSKVGDQLHTTIPSKTPPVAIPGRAKSPIGPRGLSGTRPKSSVLTRRPVGADEAAVKATWSLEVVPVAASKSLALPTLAPVAGHSPAIQQDLESETQQKQQQKKQQRRSHQLMHASPLGSDACETASAIAEGMQRVSSSTTRDCMEEAGLDSPLANSLGADQLPTIPVHSARTPARRQTDGPPTTAVVGDASARSGQTSSASTVDDVAKTQSDGQLDSRQCLASLPLPKHQSKTPPAHERLRPRHPMFFSEGSDLPVTRLRDGTTLLYERSHASNQAKEEEPAAKWSDRVRRPTELNVDFAALNTRPEASLGATGCAKAGSPVASKMSPTCSLRPPQAGLSPSPEPNPEGRARHQASSSGGLAPTRSKKPRGSRSPNGMRGILGGDDASQKTRAPALDVPHPSWRRMATPLERCGSAAGDMSPRVPVAPSTSPKPTRRPGRAQQAHTARLERS